MNMELGREQEPQVQPIDFTQRGLELLRIQDPTEYTLEVWKTAGELSQAQTIQTPQGNTVVSSKKIAEDFKVPLNAIRNRLTILRRNMEVVPLDHTDKKAFMSAGAPEGQRKEAFFYDEPTLKALCLDLFLQGHHSQPFIDALQTWWTDNAEDIQEWTTFPDFEEFAKRVGIISKYLQRKLNDFSAELGHPWFQDCALRLTNGRLFRVFPTDFQQKFIVYWQNLHSEDITTPTTTVRKPRKLAKEKRRVTTKPKREKKVKEQIRDPSIIYFPQDRITTLEVPLPDHIDPQIFYTVYEIYLQSGPDVMNNEIQDSLTELGYLNIDFNQIISIRNELRARNLIS